MRYFEASSLAPPELWPAVLRSPPWEKLGNRLAEAVVPLKRLPYEEKMTWLEGEKEAWLATELGADSHFESWFRWHDKTSLPTLRSVEPGDPAAREKLAELKLPTGLLARIEMPLALKAWKLLTAYQWQYWPDAVEAFLAKAPFAEVIDKLLEFVAAMEWTRHLLLPVDSPRCAKRMAFLFHRRRKVRELAMTWLRRHPRAALVGLIPLALGKNLDSREDAQEALLFLAAEGYREEVLAVAADYGVGDEIAALLGRHPLEVLPTKIPELPAFWNSAGLAPPRLKSGETLPPPAVDRLGTMLALARLDRPYAGIVEVQEACDAVSLAEFSWDLFESWLRAGAPFEEQWVLHAVGFFGDDACARRLAPLIRQWPGEANHARAALGLEVLAQIGSDLSLMLLQSIADKVKFKGLQDKAKEKIEQIAEQRGLSTEELADRLAPDFGLDDNGSLELDFGPRKFTVTFDEQLQPQVLDAGGHRLPDLPKPKKSDVGALARAAVERFRALKKDAQSLASLQILRLERAMLAERRFSREVFEIFIAGHPLIRHLARRLVWAAHEGEIPHYFRVAEDGSYADAADAAWRLPPNAEIAIPHPIHLPAAASAGFRQTFADYGILQPFPQLHREVRQLTSEELSQDELLRFAGHELPSVKLLGLEKRGWRCGAPQEGGVCWWFERPLGNKTLFLSFHDGIAIGDIHRFPSQSLNALTLGGEGARWYAKDLKFAALSPLEASEMLRDLESLVSG